MENQNISVTFPVQVWNVIMNALGQRPFAEIADIIGGIREQAGPQIQEAQAQQGVQETYEAAAPKNA